jgi:hypothetical protein
MNLISQVSTVNSLINFVTGEQMHVALTAIGDNHFRTAERVFRKLPDTRDQAALLRIGISHLEGAHTAYHKQWNPEGVKPGTPVEEFSLEFLRPDFRPFSCLLACKKDIYTCCLLAACWAYLKEEKLVHLAIEDAETAQQVYDKGPKTFSDSLRTNIASFDDVGYFWGPLISMLTLPDTPAISQLRKVPEVSLPDYKNNLLRILPELCNR